MLNPKETEKERIQVPENIAEIKNYDRNFMVEGVKMENKCYTSKTAKDLIEGYKSIKEKEKEYEFERDTYAVRWRYNPEKLRESNARLVEWSDGTFQLFIGDQGYDFISKKEITKLMTSFNRTTFFSHHEVNEHYLLKDNKRSF